MQSWLVSLRSAPLARGWVKVVRLLLAVVFLATGSLKLAGHNIRDGFGTAHAIDPVMPLFNAMFAVPAYWRFLGAAQFIAGTLLLTSRTAALGSVVSLAIVSNIAVLIFALPFATADRVAVVLLAVAHTGLVCWEWPRLATIVSPPDGEASATAAVTDAWNRRWVRVSTGVVIAGFIGAHLLMLVPR